MAKVFSNLECSPGSGPDLGWRTNHLFGRVEGNYFAECPLIWVSFKFPPAHPAVMAQKWYWVLLSASYQNRVMSICPIIGHVNFDHLVKVESSKSLHCKFTIFPFRINKQIGGTYFETMKISYSASNFYLLILAAIHESCLDQQWLRLKMMISTILLPTFTSLHDVIRKCFSYLFISMNTWILLAFIGLCLHSQYLFWCSVFSALGRWISKLCPLTYFLHF